MLDWAKTRNGGLTIAAVLLILGGAIALSGGGFVGDLIAAVGFGLVLRWLLNR